MFDDYPRARVLACLSPGRSGHAELRAAARLTRELGGVLLAGYVRTPQDPQTHSPDGQMLATNISLAQTLGATIVTTDADDVATGLVALARRERVTHAVIGHAGNPNALFGSGSIVEALVHDCAGIEVQVVGVPPSPRVSEASDRSSTS